MAVDDFLQYLGSATGIIGALLLALNNEWSRFGYVAFLVSNIAWLSFGWLFGVEGMVIMQAVFLVTTAIGLRNWCGGRANASRRLLRSHRVG